MLLNTFIYAFLAFVFFVVVVFHHKICFFDEV